MSDPTNKVVVEAEIHSTTVPNPASSAAAGTKDGDAYVKARAEAEAGAKKKLNARAQKGKEAWEQLQQTAQALIKEKEITAEKVKQTVEAKTQTTEAKKQTDEAKKQTEEAEKQKKTLDKSLTLQAQRLQGTAIQQKRNVSARMGAYDPVLSVPSIEDYKGRLEARSARLQKQYTAKSENGGLLPQSDFVAEAARREAAVRARYARMQESRALRQQKEDEASDKIVQSVRQKVREGRLKQEAQSESEDIAQNKLVHRIRTQVRNALLKEEENKRKEESAQDKLVQSVRQKVREGRIKLAEKESQDEAEQNRIVNRVRTQVRNARARVSDQKERQTQSELVGAANVSRQTGMSIPEARKQLTELSNKYKELGLSQKNAYAASVADLSKVERAHKGILSSLKDNLGVAAKWFVIYKGLNLITRSISSGFNYLKTATLEFYKAQEQQTLGLRGIIDANYEVTDAQGKALGIAEKQQVINDQAKATWKDLQMMGFSMVGTTADLLEVFNAILPRVSQMGGDLEKAKKVTEGTVLAANALGITYSTARTSLVSILNGNVRMSNAFTAAMGYSEKEVKKMIAAGTLLDDIIKKTAPFKLLQRETTQLLGAKLETLNELIGNVGAVAFEPLIQGAKNVITYFQDMLGYVDNITGKFVFRPETLYVLDSAKLLMYEISDQAESIYNYWVGIAKKIAEAGSGTNGPDTQSTWGEIKKGFLNPYSTIKEGLGLGPSDKVALERSNEQFNLKNAVSSYKTLQQEKFVLANSVAKPFAVTQDKNSTKAQYDKAYNELAKIQIQADEVDRALLKHEQMMTEFRVKAAEPGPYQKEYAAVVAAIGVEKKLQEEKLKTLNLKSRNPADVTDYKALLEKKKQDIVDLQSTLQQELAMHKEKQQELSEQFTNDLITRQKYSEGLDSWYVSSILSIRKKYALQKKVLEDTTKLNDQTAKDYATEALKKLPGQEATEIQGILKSSTASDNETTKYYKNQADKIKEYNIKSAKDEADTEVKIIEQKLQRKEVSEKEAIKARFKAELMAYDVNVEQTLTAFKNAGVNNLTQGQDWEKAKKDRENFIKTFEEEGVTREKLNQWQKEDLQIQMRSLEVQTKISQIDSLREQGYLSASQYWDMQRQATEELIAAKRDEISLLWERRALEKDENTKLQMLISIKQMNAETDQLISKQAIYNNSLMRTAALLEEMSSLGDIRGLGSVGGAFGSLGKAVSGFSTFQNFLKQQKQNKIANNGQLGSDATGEGADYAGGATIAATGIAKIWGGLAGAATKAAKAAPMVGAAIEAGVAIFGIFKSVFSRAARKIGEKIGKDLEAIQAAYNAGTTNLVQTMDALKAARVNAISQLSGRKGGQEQLDKILPAIDNAIADLVKQQKQIFDNFNDQLTVLRQPVGLRQTASSVMQLTKTLKEYIDAGGDAALISEYWSLSLKDIGDELQKNITSAEKEAIDRALELNDLLTQRADIIAKYNDEELKLRTQGSIERQLPNILKAGKELQELRQNRDKELEAVNRQIKVTQARVEAEKTIFDLTGSIASLKEKSIQMEIDGNAIIIAQLKEQMELLKSGGLASYVNQFIPTNLQSIIGTASSAAPVYNFGDITITAATSDPKQFATQFMDSVITQTNTRLTRRALY